MEANEFDTIFNKTFHQLSDAEKMEMKDLFTTEEEFLNMKFMLDAIQSNLNQQYDGIEPKHTIKSNLDHLFYQTYQKKGVLWYNAIPTFFISREKKLHQQNLVRIAAVLVVLVITIPLWKSNLKSDKALLSKVEKVQEEQKNQTKSKLEEDKIAPQKPRTNIKTEVSEQFSFKTNPVNVVSKSINSDVFDDVIIENEAKSNVEDLNISEPSITMAGATFVGHPDGIFVEVKNDNLQTNVFSLENKTIFLDLLTPTF